MTQAHALTKLTNGKLPPSIGWAITDSLFSLLFLVLGLWFIADVFDKGTVPMTEFMAIVTDMSVLLIFFLFMIAGIALGSSALDEWIGWTRRPKNTDSDWGSLTH